MIICLKNWLQKHSATDHLCLITGTVFIISLLPLITLSFYSHPAGDDYVFGASAHLVWAQTHSLYETVKTAVQTVVDYYYSWQGTYASIFFMALQPAVFSQRLYFLTTFLMLGMLIGGTLFLIKIIFTRYLYFPLNLRLSLSFAILILCIQTPEEGKSAFFWYNGALHYVFMHSCMLFLLAFLLLFPKLSNKTAKISCLSASCVLSFITGGSNFVTALITPVLIVILIFFCLLTRKKYATFYLLPLAIHLTGFVVSVTAPGNTVRMAMQAAPMNAVEAIYYSFVYAVKGIGEWTSLYLLFFAFLLLPFLLPALFKTDFDFPMPGITAALSFCVISATYTPSLYSMGHVYIFERTLNIMRMLFYLLFFLNLVYTTGWLTAKCKKYSCEKTMCDFLIKLKKRCAASFATGMTAFFLGLLIFSDKDEVTALSATDTLIKGYAKSYHEESLYRISLLTMEGVDEVWVPNLSVIPPLLDEQYLSADTSDYRNQAVAKWFGISTLHMSEIY